MPSMETVLTKPVHNCQNPTYLAIVITKQSQKESQFLETDCDQVIGNRELAISPDSSGPCNVLWLFSGIKIVIQLICNKARQPCDVLWLFSYHTIKTGLKIIWLSNVIKTSMSWTKNNKTKSLKVWPIFFGGCLSDWDVEENKSTDGGSFIASALADLRYPFFAPKLFAAFVCRARREQIGGDVGKYWRESIYH